MDCLSLAEVVQSPEMTEMAVVGQSNSCFAAIKESLRAFYLLNSMYMFHLPVTYLVSASDMSCVMCVVVRRHDLSL